MYQQWPEASSQCGWGKNASLQPGFSYDFHGQFVVAAAGANKQAGRQTQTAAAGPGWRAGSSHRPWRPCWCTVGRAQAFSCRAAAVPVAAAATAAGQGQTTAAEEAQLRRWVGKVI
jgi:hypothetical protein